MPKIHFRSLIPFLAAAGLEVALALVLFFFVVERADAAPFGYYKTPRLFFLFETPNELSFQSAPYRLLLGAYWYFLSLGAVLFMMKAKKIAARVTVGRTQPTGEQHG